MACKESLFKNFVNRKFRLVQSHPANFGVMEIIEAMNMSTKTMSKATPQLNGTRPDTVNTVVMIKPRSPISEKVAGSGSM